MSEIDYLFLSADVRFGKRQGPFPQCSEMQRLLRWRMGQRPDLDAGDRQTESTRSFCRTND